MTVPPASTPADAHGPGAGDGDDHALVHEDVPCEGCGYVLRGLSVDARCPECNAPVAESLHEDRLRDIPQRRLEHLRRGMRFAELGLFAVMGGLAVVGGILFLMSQS